MAQYSLAWDAYKNNICSGLSALQQNGEFVDMTLAADGHHVKVHQMVMSLVSPYIKELISSAQCPHPVIFLNKVSHSTLCSILEYIYTGEVKVAQENLAEVIQAGQELCIKGLMDMVVPSSTRKAHNTDESSSNDWAEPSTIYVETSDTQLPAAKVSIKMKGSEDRYRINTVIKDLDDDNQYDVLHQTSDAMDTDCEDPVVQRIVTAENKAKHDVQYTISAQGALQLILNRYIYIMRYTSVKSGGHRNWRCSEFWRKAKCPAQVFTQDNTITRRIGVHNHPYHDRRILKKVRDNLIFNYIQDAESKGVSVKKNKANSFIVTNTVTVSETE